MAVFMKKIENDFDASVKVLAMVAVKVLFMAAVGKSPGSRMTPNRRKSTNTGQKEL